MPFGDDGIVEDSGEWSGLPSDEARARMTAKAEQRRLRQGRRHLPHQGLGHLAAALLGHADPGDPLPAVRRGAGARRSTARAAAVERQDHGHGPLAARGSAGVRQRGLPALRRRGAARDRHHGYVRRFVLVLLPLLRRAQRQGRRSIRRKSRTGSRSINTSAAWSTPSCT